MSEKSNMQKVSEETMRFMRGNYLLDEVSDGKGELKFRRSGRTVLTIYIRDGYFDFMVIFGKAERETFEEQRELYSKQICDIYDQSKTYHDGKWMMIPVVDLDMLEEVKKLVMIKKRPNRKPFPKKQAVYSECGHRCDLCVHYTGGTINEELRNELKERLERIYGSEDWGEDMVLCSGCENAWAENPCYQKKCAAEKGVGICKECGEYPCDKALAGLRNGIEMKSILADDVTWGILPFVEGQYGN